MELGCLGEWDELVAQFYEKATLMLGTAGVIKSLKRVLEYVDLPYPSNVLTNYTVQETLNSHAVREVLNHGFTNGHPCVAEPYRSLFTDVLRYPVYNKKEKRIVY